MMKMNNLILSLENGDHWVGTETKQLRVEVKHTDDDVMEITFRECLVKVAKDGEIISSASTGCVANKSEVEQFVIHLLLSTDIY